MLFSLYLCYGTVAFTLGLDFSLLNSTVQFTPNDLTQRIYFYINNDGIVEYTEQFSLGLVSSDPSLSVVGSNSVDIQIGSDDRKTFISKIHTLLFLLLLLLLCFYNNNFNATLCALFSAELYVAFDQGSISIVEGAPVANLCVSANTSLTEIPIRVLLISSDGTAMGEFM